MVACSWIAVRGSDRASVLADLEFEETGRRGGEDAFPLWCADLPGGWLLVESHDLEFASPARIAELSRHGWAIGCLVETRVMFSGARFCEQGRERWWVLHDAEKGRYDLSMGGDLPAEFTTIRDRLFREQDAEGGSSSDVDFIFDVPMELAEVIAGYRAEGGPGAPPVMHELRPIRRAGSAGLFARFFRRR
jgi:hypothetical protein